LVAEWRASLRRFLFWALAYEVALHYRHGAPSVNPGTMFELLDYRLTPEQFAITVAEMKARRSSVIEHAAFVGIRALIRSGVTAPFGLAVRHQAALRGLMGLR
jgi:hypothetical protein